MNKGTDEMKAIVQNQMRRLKTLKNEKKKLETTYTKAGTSDFEKKRIETRLRTYLLPSIAHLEKTILRQEKIVSGVEKKIKNIQTAQNRLSSLQAQLRRRPAAAGAPPAAAGAPRAKTNLEQFEENLLREFGPITDKNIMNEARKLRAEENMALNRIMRNYARAKTNEERKYYSNMMNAVLNESSLRPLLPEEEAEVNAYLASMGGQRRKTRKASRHRRQGRSYSLRRRR